MLKFRYMVIGIAMLNFQSAYAQDLCKVLMPSIALEYTGDCKKGLAHGKGEAIGIDQYTGEFKKGLPNGEGIYYWSTGEMYEGEWRNGMRDGLGSYHFFTLTGKDTLQKGKWLKDEYIGVPPEDQYKIVRSQSIPRYTFRRIKDGNSINIKIKLGANVILQPNNLTLWGDSGTTITDSFFMGFDNVSFPFKSKISFDQASQLSAFSTNRILSFEIFEPGSWEIVIFL